MLLAAAALTWVLSIYDGPIVISTQTFDTEAACQEALAAYHDSFDDHEDSVRHQATCAYPATDTME